jgi:hypothetical protein
LQGAHEKGGVEGQIGWFRHNHLRQGCLPLGTALCRGGASEPASLNFAKVEAEQPLTREVSGVARPVPAPGPVPGVEWVNHVETDPIEAMGSSVLGWFPAKLCRSGSRWHVGGAPRRS